KALPDPMLAPLDEVSEAFVSALEALRSCDEDYIRAKGGSQKHEPSFEIERMLRDKARAQLGLAPLLRKGKIDGAAFARAHGIDPSYEPPDSGAANQQDQGDRYIQTLFLQHDLDRRERKLHERYEDHLQEKGINVLYLAVGFLEWYEDEFSETCHHAP